MDRLTHQQRADMFRAWYSTQGHWVYSGRADAMRVWRERGINGRPQHTAGAEALLTEWAAGDWMPAFATFTGSAFANTVHAELAQ